MGVGWGFDPYYRPSGGAFDFWFCLIPTAPHTLPHREVGLKIDLGTHLGRAPPLPLADHIASRIVAELGKNVNVRRSA